MIGGMRLGIWVREIIYFVAFHYMVVWYFRERDSSLGNCIHALNLLMLTCS